MTLSKDWGVVEVKRGDRSLSGLETELKEYEIFICWYPTYKNSSNERNYVIRVYIINQVWSVSHHKQYTYLFIYSPSRVFRGFITDWNTLRTLSKHRRVRPFLLLCHPERTLRETHFGTKRSTFLQWSVLVYLLGVRTVGPYHGLSPKSLRPLF